MKFFKKKYNNEETQITLSHVDEYGNAQMVAVDEKEITHRTAIASGKIQMLAETQKLIRESSIKKGDVLTVAKIAAINAAKRTSELIPLCHTIPLEKCNVTFTYISETEIQAIVEVAATAKTGVEMEAITAVSTALVTIYDMAKAVDRAMIISDIKLLEKHGGKSDFSAKL